jgi:hypothetical protein
LYICCGYESTRLYGINALLSIVYSDKKKVGQLSHVNFSDSPVYLLKFEA